MTSQDFRPLRYRKRWFCYLDLLGFNNLVNDKNIQDVIPIYKKALSKLNQSTSRKKLLGIIHSWFSDTFIIYSKNDKEEDFIHVEQAGRLFFQGLILNEIPVRGALTHGSLYSQSAKNIFVGPALIDAYCYAEHQNWLGFILTPNVEKHLRNSSIPVNRRNHYRLVTQEGIINHHPSHPVYAFAFNNGEINGSNPYIKALQSMRDKAPEAAMVKYDNAIQFAKQYHKPIGYSEITKKEVECLRENRCKSNYF